MRKMRETEQKQRKEGNKSGTEHIERRRVDRLQRVEKIFCGNRGNTEEKPMR